MNQRVYVPLAVAIILTGLSVVGFGWEADFEPSTFNPHVGEPVSFAICEPCLDPGTYEYVWDFDGDGVSDLVTSEPVVDYVYEEDGFFAVELTSTAADGRRKSKRLGILVGTLPAYAVRETLRQADGAIFVLITVYIVDEVTGGVGLTEALPRGWMHEEVDVGGAIKAERGDPKRYEVAWGSQFDAGSEAKFSYRLIPGYGGSTVTFDGMMNGYSDGVRFHGAVCGELEIAP